MMPVLKIGTRGSALALAQAEHVRELLGRSCSGLDCEKVVIRTRGDDLAGKQADLPEEALKGLFVKEIEDALLKGRIDLAVHSAKDMETDLPDALAIGAVLKREDPRDAVVSGGRAFKDLPAGARVGVSSLRRRAQLKRLRRDLETVPIRGNVDTRLKKLDAGEYDALVLAAAGLKRLGLSERIGEFLEPAVFLPAPCQGALAIEIRRDRTGDLAGLLRAVEDAASRREVEAERSLLKALGGDCRVPVGALASAADENSMTLEAVVLSPDGLKAIRESIAGPAKSAQRLGADLASRLRAAGADRLLYGAWKK